MVNIKPIIRLVFAGLSLSSAQAAEQEVALELSIPTQKTYVIGDRIELDWNFTNRTTNALAFMWEGCCRVNGRVEMKRLGTPSVPKGRVRPSHTGVGPGIYSSGCLHCRLAKQRSELEVKTAPQGPATAHMFAKAASLPATGQQSFNSFLANWVLLEESGDYQLTGNYLGVHPKQRPQMLRRGRLWTGITKSPAIDLSLLSVTDYLAEREARARVRGIEIGLFAPPHILPFRTNQLFIAFRNQGSQTASITFPGDIDIWIVNDKGVRLESSRYLIKEYGRQLVLTPQKPVIAKFALDHDIWAGRPFGNYKVFVELKESTNSIRVPSNPVGTEWKLDQKLVRELVIASANRPVTGRRNPQLKLLRQHLADLMEPLSQLASDGMGDKARELIKSLRLASRLKKIQPQPGTATLNLGVNAQGVASFQEPAIRQALSDLKSPFQQLDQIVAVRRHLGWTLAVNLRVNRQARLSALAPVLVSLAKHQLKPTAKIFNSTATAFSTVSFGTQTNGATDISQIKDWSTLPTHPTLAAAANWTWQQLIDRTKPLIDKGRSFELVVR